MAYSKARYLSTILLASGRVKRASSNWGDGTNAITLANLPTITNAKLDNSSVTINSVATALGTSADENIQDLVGAMFTSNTETGITATYQDSDGTIDLVIGTLNQNTTGSAATLTTARTIGGVSFDGSANINLPGVNAAGTQNTTGSAATLTTARTIGGVSFDGSANINLPGVNAAGNQNTTGSAATLTTARTIGGVSFDGSANINLPGVNAAGNQNTTGNAATATKAYITNSDGDGNYRIVWIGNDGSTSQNETLYQTGGVTLNASTNAVTATTFVGALTGNVTGNLLGTPTAPTAAANTNTTQVATTAYVQTELTDLINGAPGTLDTLNELAAAINDDANYNSTLTTALATKLPLAGGTMTGNLTITTTDTELVLNDSESTPFGIRSNGGVLDIRNSNSGEIGIRYVNDGAVSLYYNNVEHFATTTGGAEMKNAKHLYFQDSGKAIFGGGSDLQIYHDSLNSYIKDTGTGSLVLASGGLFIQNAAADENMIRAVENGAVTLYHNGLAKLDTNSGGVTVTGTAILGGASFVDDATIYLGTGLDLRLYHSSGNGFINNQTGVLYIDQNQNDGNMIFRNDDQSGGLAEYIVLDGGGGKIKIKRALVAEGNVGIGEPNPAYPLAIQADGIAMRLDGTANTTRSIFFRNTTTANPAQLYSDGSLRIYTEDASTDITLDAVQNIILDADDGGHVRFKDAGTQYASIYKSGSDAILDSTGDITLDSADRIILSADDNGEIRFQDGASLYGQFKDDDDRFRIEGLLADKDMLFVLNDGGTATTALKLDADPAGDATFYGNVTVNNLYVADDIGHSGDTDTYISFDTNIHTYYAGGTRLLDLQVGDVIFNEGGGGVDFRVESAADSNSFSIDGTTGNVGIGLAPTLTRLNVLYNAANWTAIFKNHHSSAYGLSIDMSGSSAAGGQADIFALACYTPGTNQGFFVTKSGNAGIGNVAPDHPLVIKSNTGASAVKIIGRDADSVSSISLTNSAVNAESYLQSNGHWFRARANEGFHWRKDNTPIVTDTDAFTIQDMNLVVTNGTATFTDQVSINNADGGPTIYHESTSVIAGSGQKAKVIEGVYAYNTVSAGNTLTIPITDQSSVWHQYLVDFMFLTGEYNVNADARAGTLKVAFTSLNAGAAAIVELDKTGNVASASGSDSNLIIEFTNAYTSGLNDNEGIVCYYKILGYNPTALKMWDATLD